MRVARIARPDAIYGASAAAQTFSVEEMENFIEEEEEEEEKKYRKSKKNFP